MFSKKAFFVFQETELSYISRVVKTNFLIFLVLKIKTPVFSQENPAGFFRCFHFSPFLCVSMFHLSRMFSFFAFLRCFIFHLFQVFHFSPFLGVSYFIFLECFHVLPFLDVFIFHLSWVFSFFNLSQVFHFSPFFGCFYIAVPWVLRIWESFFYFQTFFTLHPFLTFGTTCFYQGFPGSWQFFIEGCRAFHWGSKLSPRPSVCLNHTVFSKRYSVSSIYVLRPYRTLYQPLPGFEPAI